MTWTVWDWTLRIRPVPDGKANERSGGAISEFFELFNLQIHYKLHKSNKINKILVVCQKTDSKMGNSRNALDSKWAIVLKTEDPMKYIV